MMSPSEYRQLLQRRIERFRSAATQYRIDAARGDAFLDRQFGAGKLPTRVHPQPAYEWTLAWQMERAAEEVAKELDKLGSAI